MLIKHFIEHMHSSMLVTGASENQWLHVSVEVKKGSRLLLQQRIVKVSHKDNFGSLLDRLDIAKLMKLQMYKRSCDPTL